MSDLLKLPDEPTDILSKEAPPLVVGMELFHEAREMEFWRYVAERQAIYHRRFVEREYWPWSRDPIMLTTHLCNVYRCLDPATIWLREHILEADLPSPTKLFNILLFRVIGREETFHDLGVTDPRTFRRIDFEARLREIHKNQRHTLVGPHCRDGGKNRRADLSADPILNLGFLAAKLHAGLSQMVKHCLGRREPERIFYYLEDNEKRLCGLGERAAYEILLDLMTPIKRSRGRSLASSPTRINEWVPVKWKKVSQMIEVISGIGDPYLQEEFLRELRERQEEQLAKLTQPFHWLTATDGRRQLLDLGDIYHSLGQFYTYWSAQQDTVLSTRSRFYPPQLRAYPKKMRWFKA